MKRTIRLDHRHILRDGVVLVLTRDRSIGSMPDCDDPHYSEKMARLDMEQLVYRPSERYVIGAKAVLVSRTNVSPDVLRAGDPRPVYDLHFDLAGVPGNMNPTIKEITGWRGTTNDVRLNAHGIVRITGFRKLRGGCVAVTVISTK